MALFKSGSIRAESLALAVARISTGQPEETAQEVVLRMWVEALESWWCDLEAEDFWRRASLLKRRWQQVAEWGGVDSLSAAAALTRALDLADRRQGRPGRNLAGALHVASVGGLVTMSEAALEAVFAQASATRATLMTALGREAADLTPELPGLC